MSGKNNKIADLSVLLKEEYESYYWIGFLMADGHFYKHGALKLHLSEVDRPQINKFKEFVNYTGKSNKCSISAMNPPIVHAIMDKFKITNRKTYEPCDINNIKDDLMFSLIVGMFDGDGCFGIRKNKVYNIAIKLHGNWLSNLEIIENFLYKYFQIEKSKDKKLTRLKADGYSLLILSDRYLISLMRKKVEELNLPVMDRKWNKIDINYISKYRKHKTDLPKILELIETGMTYEDVGKIFGLTRHCIGVKVHRHKKKFENENHTRRIENR